MLLTNDDLARLKLARPDMDFHFEADDGFLQLKTRDGPPATGGAGRPCVFLHADGSCSVHDIRPEGCRVYPAVWDESLRGAELDDMYCPHTDNFVLDDGVAGAAKRLAARLLAERRARRSGR